MECCLDFKPVITGSGFKMEGYYVWCGSVLHEDGMYYLFASRWKKEKEFPGGYMTDSEIVLAQTDNLNKPFEFKKVIIGKRDGNYWDSVMAHNPYIIKLGDKYVLYYIGNTDGRSQTRKIGYAYCDSVDGEWIRAEQAIDLPEDANNPCVVSNNGELLLYYRDGGLRVSVAKAEKFDGEYKVVKENIFPKGMVEDMFVYHDGEKYIMIAEDAGGAYTGLKKGGVRFLSHDGITWDEDSAVPAYGFNITYDDGRTEELQRRERPMILFDNDKKYLFTSAKINGELKLEGGDTWNMVQEFVNVSN